MYRGKKIVRGKLTMYVMKCSEMAREAGKYIKENYNIDSEYDAKDKAIRIIDNGEKDALEFQAAKEYLANEFPYLDVK